MAPFAQPQLPFAPQQPETVQILSRIKEEVVNSDEEAGGILEESSRIKRRTNARNYELPFVENHLLVEKLITVQ